MIKRSIKDVVFLVIAYSLCVIVFVGSCYILRDNLIMGMLMCGVMVVNLSMWIETETMLRDFNRMVLEKKHEYEKQLFTKYNI